MARSVGLVVSRNNRAFLWWIADSKRLSGLARKLIANELSDIVVSAASAWEIPAKFRIGELPKCEAVAADVAGQGFVELGISVADAERAGVCRVARIPRFLNRHRRRPGYVARDSYCLGWPVVRLFRRSSGVV